MKFFEVYEKKLGGKVMTTLVCSDGSHEDGATPEYNNYDNRVDEILGYSVMEYEEDGTLIGEKFYAVDRVDEQYNTLDVLERIKAEHDPSVWNCYNW